MVLLVIPKNSTVDIHTDSLNIVKHFEKENLPIWKLEQNKFNWKIIEEIIQENDLKVTFIKVKAHSGIEWNEKVDELAKSGYYLNNNEIEINYDNTLNINTIPYWRNRCIQMKTRHFIKYITHNIEFENFLNLNRIKKYKDKDIH